MDIAVWETILIAVARQNRVRLRSQQDTALLSFAKIQSASDFNSIRRCHPQAKCDMVPRIEVKNEAEVPA
jgi:hypothetical protein